MKMKLSGRKGFTLVEILIVVAIVVLLALLIIHPLMALNNLDAVNAANRAIDKAAGVGVVEIKKGEIYYFPGCESTDAPSRTSSFLLENRNIAFVAIIIPDPTVKFEDLGKVGTILNQLNERNGIFLLTRPRMK